MSDGDPLVEADATFELLSPPTTRDLYFWALQVSFVDRGRKLGAAHTGLQWHPRAPGGAVNWGGYRPGGGELPGSRSALPAVDSANTRRWTWHPGRRYRLRVHPVSGGWRSTIADLDDGRAVDVRDLHLDAPALSELVVWTEAFGPCGAASSARWSDLVGRTGSGRVARPSTVLVNYQAADADGCPDTNVTTDGLGILQVTGTPRTTPQGAVVAVVG